MKICTKCKELKSPSEFYKDKAMKDGLTYQCKLCCKARSSSYAEQNKEKVAAYHAAYQKEHAEEIAAYHAIYHKTYYSENKEKINAYHATYRAENRDLVDARSAAWAEANPGKRNAITIKYRASKLQRTPPWLSEEDYKKIQQFYIDAARLTKETGILHTVDHKVPLQGENVSGLHVPGNLQILVGPGPAGNFAKGNKFPL